MRGSEEEEVFVIQRLINNSNSVGRHFGGGRMLLLSSLRKLCLKIQENVFNVLMSRYVYSDFDKLCPVRESTIYIQMTSRPPAFINSVLRIASSKILPVYLQVTADQSGLQLSMMHLINSHIAAFKVRHTAQHNIELIPLYLYLKSAECERLML